RGQHERVVGRPHHRPRPRAGGALFESPLEGGPSPPDRRRADGPGGPRRAPRPRHGRELAIAMRKKVLVLGLDCAAPELLFGYEELETIRRVMDAGCHGPLESVVPPITVPAWMCLATSQDPGSLGIYGFRNRTDHSYSGLGIVNSRSIDALAIWDQIAREG